MHNFSLAAEGSLTSSANASHSPHPKQCFPHGHCLLMLSDIPIQNSLDIFNTTETVDY